MKPIVVVLVSEPFKNEQLRQYFVEQWKKINKDYYVMVIDGLNLPDDADIDIKILGVEQLDEDTAKELLKRIESHAKAILKND